ncbi:acyl-CoA-binding protein [Fulvivirgaceae bacterium BMA12]|uniref:Acyl-CoA-binding protein n=1 Tax=Agaribacillus aureus TaxID=3051825 RepID=A0ABT8L9J3_9BACT|nr:acyl-CoA-binding protein [Fulvivirgaceae bacterium BMA12]
MSVEESFKEAVDQSKRLTERPSNDILLKIYALYKQATVGDVNEERPGGFDFKAIAKFNAWESMKGKSAEQAMLEYIALINELSN